MMAAARPGHRTLSFIQQDSNNSRYNQRLSKEQWADLKPLILDLVYHGETIAAILVDLRSKNINVTRSQLGTQLKKWSVGRKSNQQDLDDRVSPLGTLKEIPSDDEGDDDPMNATSFDHAHQNEGMTGPQLPSTPINATQVLSRPGDADRQSLEHKVSSRIREEVRLEQTAPDVEPLEPDYVPIEKKSVEVNGADKELEILGRSSIQTTTSSTKRNPGPELWLKRHGYLKVLPIVMPAAQQNQLHEFSVLTRALQPSEDPAQTFDTIQASSSGYANGIIASLVGLTLTESCSSSMSSGFRSFKDMSARISGSKAASTLSLSSLSSGHMSWRSSSVTGMKSNSFQSGYQTTISDVVMGEADTDDVPEDEGAPDAIRFDFLPHTYTSTFSHRPSDVEI